MTRNEEGTHVARPEHVRERDPQAQGWYRVETNGLAIASLVLGIVWLFGIGSILALVFGYIGKSQIDRSGGRESGRGLAIAGIVLGWVGVGLLLLAITLVILGFLNMGPMQRMPGMPRIGM